MGGGTALFVAGTCFCPQAPLATLELLVDGRPQPLLADSMPRLDYFASLHPRLDPYATAGLKRDPDSPEDPLLLSYRSGFWGLATLASRTEDGDCELALRARLRDGRTATAPIGRLPAVAQARSAQAADGGPSSPAQVAICMATYNPPPELFARQVESIRAQTHTDWVCYVSDDRSNAGSYTTIEQVIGDDPRFVLSRSQSRRGFYANFERALAMVPPGVAYVALADQDDRWYPDKLETLLAEIGDAQLVYSDARIVARDGAVIADSYWGARGNNHTDITSVLVANSVTGAASLLRRELLDHALPFPPAQFGHYHDHWLGLTALARGSIAFVQKPLYDYVQHGEASLGHAAANRMASLRERLSRRRPPRERIRMWRLHYFADVCRLLQVATILLTRNGEAVEAGKRRALERFLAGEHSIRPVAELSARGVRELLSAQPETLGAEWMLSHALLWRRLLTASVRDRPRRGLRLDAVPPPTLAPAPERSGLEGPVREVAEKIAPLDLGVSDSAPRRINLLIPTIDLRHFFGGYITKLNLARRLAEQGLPVRVVTVDPVGALPPGWKRTIESYSGLAGVFDRVEVAFARGAGPLEVSPDDAFIATTWWSAHIAAHAVRALGGARFVYLIQEYEPFTFPMGSYAALAAESYRFEHFAVFSSELLREYFRRHGIGVFATGASGGDESSVSFENAITPVPAPSEDALASRTTRRLLFYARPEQHAARNMFELGTLALARAAQDGLLAGWELRGIGSAGPGRRVPLGGGAELQLLTRSAQDDYAAMLREHDVGLALMYTPHPSLVPIEMASAGMLTVTNSFENKTAAALSAISPNLITAEPTVSGVVAGLGEAIAGAGDHRRRVAGSAVAWSREWNVTFDGELLGRIAAALGHPLRAPVRS